jgi:hypothetical protein
MLGFVFILMFQRHYQPQSASDIGTHDGSKQLITNTFPSGATSVMPMAICSRICPLNKRWTNLNPNKEKDAEGFEKVPQREISSERQNLNPILRAPKPTIVSKTSNN